MKPFKKIKDVNKKDAHDRLIDLNRQSEYISEGCEACIKNRPLEFENYPFYIFAHKRDLGMDERHSLFNDDLHFSLVDATYIKKYNSFSEVPSARLIWSPRLTKPFPQTNSMLFKAYPPTDMIKVIWILPAQDLWGQYTKGKLTESSIISESIEKFKNRRSELSEKEEDDLPEEKIDAIYKEMSKNKSFYAYSRELV